MSDALSPSVGLCVVHLFCDRGPLTDAEEVIGAVKRAQDSGVQVVSAAILGHKAELAFMALADDMWKLRDLQTGLLNGGLSIVDSYVSLTEISEYAAGVPDEMKNMRLYPQLPPEGKRAFCFYPMSKKRDGDANWFTLPFDNRKDLMHEHGTSGRKFAGRIVQVISGSTGLDNYEWGVTLFGVRPDDLKDVVYTMRFDRASAVYAEFGPFYVGIVEPIESLMGRTA